MIICAPEGYSEILLRCDTQHGIYTKIVQIRGIKIKKLKDHGQWNLIYS